MSKARNIYMKVIPHKDQRANGIGDYYLDGMGTLIVAVSDMQNDLYHFLVFYHEIIEFHACEQAGIEEYTIQAWDEAHMDAEEPGELTGSPYKDQHLFALAKEKEMADTLGVDWDEYCKAIAALYQ